MSLIIDLDKEENNLIKALVKNILADPSLKPETFCNESRENSRLLPEKLKLTLMNFIGLSDLAKNNSDMSFLLIKNIDLSDFVVPETPACNNQKIGEKTELARIQSMLISFIGEMISYEAEGYGRLFQDVVPIKSMENVQVSVSSKFELEIHTEQAFSKLKPDILCLGCLKGDKNAFTYILPVKKILECLSGEEIDMLYKPLWKIGVDLSFKLNGINFVEGDIRGPIPILYGSKEMPTLIFDQDLMEGITPEAEIMIKKIVNIYYEYRIEHSLKPGEIILINNNKATHGRSPFTPKYDGTDRFLVRCFGVLDYKKSEYARPNNKRVVSAIFS
jgi:L-asparagine oxygenase